MDWPQIREYSENGKTIKVFRPAHALKRNSWEELTPLLAELDGTIKGRMGQYATKKLIRTDNE